MKGIKNLLTIGFAVLLMLGMSISLSACNKEDGEKYQVTKEEYENAFSLESFQNVTMSIVSQINNKDIQSYFYNDGDNYALCRYDGDVQYYGRYYGIENGEEFCYLYGNEQLENFTQEQATWKKYDNPSAYKYEGVYFALSYKQEYSSLKYDSKIKAYSYTNSAYGTDIVYTYYFVDKQVTKYTVKEGDAYIFSCDFYDYGTTEIPILDLQSGSKLCEHTCEWVGYEGGHQKVYTCGCSYPDIVELHRDNDDDNKCDVCGWAMAETSSEETYLLIRAYEEKYPQAGKATILHYCGKYESGAIVAMLAGSYENFDCALWTETVADYDFNYSDANRIRVLYKNEFYTLAQAYENGYLTKENIKDIHTKWET